MAAAFRSDIMTLASKLSLGVLAAAFATGCMVDSEQPEDVETISSAVKAESKDKADKGNRNGADEDRAKDPEMPEFDHDGADREARRDQRHADHAAKKAEREARREAARAAREAKKALKEAQKAARFRDDFEGHELGARPEDYAWFAKGGSYYEVTDQRAKQGNQSLVLRSVIGPKDNRIGAKVCAPVGSTTALTARFKLWIESNPSPSAWSFVGISNNPELAAYWWILPDGTVTNLVEDVGKIELDAWNDIRITVDLADDLATFTLNGVSVSSDIDSVWGLIASPIECLRLTTSFQNMFVDKVDIEPEILSL